MTNPLVKLEQTQPFTPNQAWALFRLAAIGEAIGWSLLISGIFIKYQLLHGNDIPVFLAGQFHGVLFILYFVTIVIIYSSLQWSRKRTLVALAAGVPPFGSLVFEQWAAYKRRSAALKNYREVTVRAIIVRDHEVLAIQTKDSGYYYLPGGLAEAGETAEAALERLVSAQTGVTPAVGRLAYLSQPRTKSTEHLELFFVVTNASDFSKVHLTPQHAASARLDELRYVVPAKTDDLRPAFLQTESIIVAAQATDVPAKLI